MNLYFFNIFGRIWLLIIVLTEVDIFHDDLTNIPAIACLPLVTLLIFLANLTRVSHDHAAVHLFCSRSALEHVSVGRVRGFTGTQLKIVVTCVR